MERIEHGVHHISGGNMYSLLVAGDLETWRKSNRIRKDWKWKYRGSDEYNQLTVRPATAEEIERLQKMYAKSDNLRKAAAGKSVIVMTLPGRD